MLGLGTGLVLFILLLQARHPLWSTHLSTDVGVFAQRAATFVTRGSWAALERNEYQPGALFFFLVPQALARLGIPYLSGFFLVNAVLLALHVILLKHLGGAKAAWAGLLLFLAAGPISYFRFELFVSFLVLLAFWVWLARPLWGGILLGFAAGVKVYPFFLLPVLWIHRSSAAWRGTVRVTIGFFIGLLAVLTAFFSAGGNIASLVGSFTYHLEKPVSMESPIATLAVATGRLTGAELQPVNAYGIHGFSLPSSVPRLALLGLILSLGFFYGFAMWRTGTHPSRAALPALGVLSSLLVWLTGLQPQYLLWPIAFAALLSATSGRFLGTVIAGLHALALVSEQVLYPVYYSEFLDIFYERTSALLPLTMLFLSTGSLILLYGAILWVAARRTT